MQSSIPVRDLQNSRKNDERSHRPGISVLIVGLFCSVDRGNIDGHSRIIDLPLPTPRLASAALQALRVDKELSPLVCRSFSTISAASLHPAGDATLVHTSEETILRTEYKATTNRMLRVAVNGFMESLSVVLGVMEELDVDVLGMET